MSNKIHRLSPASPPRPQIQSIGRAGDILDALLRAPQGVLQLGDIARACGLVKTTAFTLVDSLVCIGLIDRDPKGGYRLGLRNLSHGRAVEQRLDIVSLARPALLRLCALTRETVNLAMARPLEAFIVESFEGSRNLRVSSYAGTSAPYHSTACGRVLLAHQPPAVIESFYHMGRFERFTEYTISTPAALQSRLEQCRARGWAIEREENEVGASCIAAPVIVGGIVQAAISIAAPATRLDDSEASRFAEILLTETAAIAQGRSESAPSVPSATV
ncbi:MAG TPA: IclR family transcriptional regulator [Steroidobacteraceae bacterium]|jgi:IclR family acetate operon transcriptional repressor|nr:IclR family transcriptional regulator [Steroidobacteraceae bacterium]